MEMNNKKSVKKIKTEYIIAIILIVLVVIIFIFSNSNFNLLQPQTNLTNLTDYSTLLEIKLKNTISQIEGAGKTSVTVTVDGTSEEEVLKETTTKIENGVKSIIESVILVNGKPYVTKTLNPNIIGIVVVCEGAENLNVKLAITEVITTTLTISSEKIRILKMK